MLVSLFQDPVLEKLPGRPEKELSAFPQHQDQATGVQGMVQVVGDRD